MTTYPSTGDPATTRCVRCCQQVQGLECRSCVARREARETNTSTTTRVRSTRALYAEARSREAARDGLCRHCGTVCYGDCRA